MVCRVLDVFKTTQEVNILLCCLNFLLFFGLFLTLWDISGHSNSKLLDWFCWFLLSARYFCWVLFYEYCLLVSLALNICILIILSLHLQCDTFSYFLSSLSSFHSFTFYVPALPRTCNLKSFQDCHLYIFLLPPLA